MAKGIGLIGNFKGKVGNTVGYKLSASNNGQTQGIRVYQPIVKNPKTAAQAEQRAKLLAVNATYRALRMVIDRGNEGLPYGNKSRLAWLRGALKSNQMPWFEKGAVVTHPVGCLISKGSLQSLSYSPSVDAIGVNCDGTTSSTQVTTIGDISTALKAGNTFLKDGDQVTFVFIPATDSMLAAEVVSFVIDTTSAVTANTLFAGVTAANDKINFEGHQAADMGIVIVSRQGNNGEHLRSNEILNIPSSIFSNAPYDADSKAAAIESYRSSAASNSDWEEESIQ